MFGTLRPCKDETGTTVPEAYRRYYCGLCLGLKQEFGRTACLLNSYDVCLAYLIADSICPETTVRTARCPFAPWRKVEYVENTDILPVFSHVDYLLAYHKFADDIADEGGISGRFGERMMRRKYQVLEKKEPDRCEVIRRRLEELHAQERENRVIGMEEAARPFARLLEELMSGCIADPVDAQIFGRLSYWIGVWIYVADACTDAEKDEKNGAYNPVFAGGKDAKSALLERRKEILLLLMRCREAMRQHILLLNLPRNRKLLDDFIESMLPGRVAEVLAAGGGKDMAGG